MRLRECLHLHADGYPTDGLTRTEMSALLRGPSGSAVVLGIARPGLARPHAVYLERRPLPQPPLKVVCPAVGYLLSSQQIPGLLPLVTAI